MTTPVAEDWKVQASYKFGPHQEALLNVRAPNLHDLATEVRNMPEVVGDLVVAADLLRAESVGTVGVPVSQNQVDTQGHPAGQGRTSPAPPAQAAPQNPAHFCHHGGRVRRSGTSSKGNWVGWFCQLPKGDPNQCQAYFE